MPDHSNVLEHSVLIVFVDLRMALFLLVIVSMIDVHLMAWMWAFDISLDAISYAVLVMAVGLTVDYLIHITHSIVEAQPQADISRMSDQEIYASKLEIALNAMGISVWFVLFNDGIPTIQLIIDFLSISSIE